MCSVGRKTLLDQCGINKNKVLDSNGDDDDNHYLPAAAMLAATA